MRFFRVKEGFKFIYFGHKRVYEGTVFVIREKTYFCRKAKKMLTMTVDEQVSSTTMDEVKANQPASPQGNTNWQEQEQTRLAMANASAEAEIAQVNEARIAREEEDAAAIKAVEEGQPSPTPVTPVTSEVSSEEGQGDTTQNVAEEVV